MNEKCWAQGLGHVSCMYFVTGRVRPGPRGWAQVPGAVPLAPAPGRCAHCPPAIQCEQISKPTLALPPDSWLCLPPAVWPWTWDVTSWAWVSLFSLLGTLFPYCLPDECPSFKAEPRPLRPLTEPGSAAPSGRPGRDLRKRGLGHGKGVRGGASGKGRPGQGQVCTESRGHSEQNCQRSHKDACSLPPQAHSPNPHSSLVNTTCYHLRFIDTETEATWPKTHRAGT